METRALRAIVPAAALAEQQDEKTGERGNYFAANESIALASAMSLSVSAAGIMRGKRHLDSLVDVEPFRVVIHFFGHQRRARHEAEGLVEILEDEFARDRIAAVDLAPLRQSGERRLARRTFELGHRLSPSGCLREDSRHGNANAMDWTDAQAPTLDEIERLAVEGFASLPEEFRALTGEWCSWSRTFRTRT